MRLSYHHRSQSGIFQIWQSAVVLFVTTLGPITSSVAEVNSCAPLLTQPLLLDVSQAGSALIAVGDHGTILRTENSGSTWLSIPTPVSSLLTAVNFPDPLHGWAVGHDGVILATDDAGRTWQRRDDGQQTETVYLDVLFLDPRHGFIVGAYGKFLSTTDGGRTWQSHRPSENDLHYNRLTADDEAKHLFLAGEAGALLVSSDCGVTWQTRRTPYDGSLFGVLPLGAGSLLTYGLRGHILRSPDLGLTWTPAPNAVEVLIMAGLRLKNGDVVLAGLAGNFLISHDHGQTFLPWKPSGFSSGVSELIETPTGELLSVGEAGAVTIKLP